jgi:DNA-binding transcriptional ArsR family regulator
MCCERISSKQAEKAKRLRTYFKALHCPTRWSIIGLIGGDTVGTGQILEGLKASEGSLARSSLYYHISELEKAGIIEMAGYREVGGGAPEKTWRLRTREIRINLLEDVESDSGLE